MKILHLITRMDGGGSAVNTLITAQHQAAFGHDVVLAFGPSEESNMSAAEEARVHQGLAEFEEFGGTVLVVPSLQREVGWHDKRAIGDLKKIIAAGFDGSDCFDIVHTHTSKAGALGRVAASQLRAGIKKYAGLHIVHTPHGHIFHGYFSSMKTKIFLRVEQWLAERTDVLIALTQAERDDHLALKVGQAEQWQVVPSGVDVDAIAEWAWEHPVSEEHKPWDVVSIGRLVSIKGMDRLIRAWAHVVQQRPDAMLALVGDGEDRRDLELLASALNIVPNVTFVGWTNPLPELTKAKTFALLSHNEGMGRAVVEAMAAGLPCVVSNVCGLKELVDDKVGIVVDNADDSKSVAQALMTPWPRDMKPAIHARAEKYSIAAMMKGLDEVYDGLMAKA
ncbi:MAG: hypothetical protein AUK35_02325 [Zetaproteobacteria bacterium CG2_30_46_52]|nr:MAG: hypothetical protein AUK35_02325 [Zetaproteobacteria bacterium CG2_30_46_52]